MEISEFTTEQETKRWYQHSFAIMTVMLVFAFLVLPLLLRQTPVSNEEAISETTLIVSLYGLQLPLLFALIALALFSFRSIPIVERFAFKNWKPIYLILPLLLEIFILPATATISLFVQSIATRYGYPLDEPLLESFLTSCSWSTFAVIGLAGVFIAPVVEELIFRHIMFNFFKPLCGTFSAVAIVAILFAAVHASLIKTPALIFLAVILQVLYIHNRSVIPSIFMHIAHNATAFIILACFRLLTSAGFFQQFL